MSDDIDERARERQEAIALGPALAERYGLTLWPARGGTLLDIGNQEYGWQLAEDAQGYVAYRVSRGNRSVILRDPRLAPVLKAFRRALTR